MIKENYMDTLHDSVTVEWIPLGQVAENLNGLRKPIASGLREPGNIPYYGASGVVDYVKDYIFEGDFLLISEDGANLIARKKPIAFSVSGKIWVNNHAHVLKFKTDTERKYVEYFFESIDIKKYITGAAQPKLNRKNLDSIRVPIPFPDTKEKSIEIQAEIVSTLDRIKELTTELTTELTSELKARKKQYRYYRDKVFAFDKCEVEMRKLKKVAKIKNGKDWKKLKSGDVPVYGTGGVIAYVSEFSYDKPTVLIPRKGSISNVYYLEEPFWNVDTIYYTEIDDKQVLPKYLYYFIDNYDLSSLDTGSGRPSLTQAVLNEIEVPIPHPNDLRKSLEVQEYVVSVLDKFEELTTSISEGLTNEVEQRNKQYNYYRDMLLNFQKDEVDV